MPVYRTESCLLEQSDDLELDWSDLQARSDCSYFQSWGWIGVWLEQIALELQPIVIKVWCDDHLVGLGLFVTADIRRHSFIHSKAMFLNEYPLKGKNMVIEYNGLLVARGHESAACQQAIRYLLAEFEACDEFMFGAMAENSVPEDLFNRQIDNAKYFINDSSLSWSVNLDHIPEQLEDYLAGLSKNRRAQIRRSLRLYEAEGALQIEEASNMAEALIFLDELKQLHTRRWQTKGRPGSFANPTWEAFHRRLIATRFAAGEIQLLKVSAGSVKIGYLYNFLWRKRVYVLQTGFEESEDKRMMPGYVTHVLAIMHNKSQGMSVYDLMHGDALYKRLLCNQSHRLVWAVLQRQRLKFMVEKLG